MSEDKFRRLKPPRHPMQDYVDEALRQCGLMQAYRARQIKG